MNETEERTVFQLARLAGCADPDSADSPGGKWLQLVADSAAELSTHYEPEDAITQTADDLVPVYTHGRWQVFVDLAAYNEDTTEYGGFEGDMTAAAGVALFMIAERLLTALVEEITAEDADEDEGGEIGELDRKLRREGKIR